MVWRGSHLTGGSASRVAYCVIKSCAVRTPALAWCDINIMAASMQRLALAGRVLLQRHVLKPNYLHRVS